MTTEKQSRFTVISNEHIKATEPELSTNTEYHTNPMYEKLLQFRNLQEQQKKKFSVDDLFKLC